MKNMSAAFLYIQHRNISKRARIRILSSPFREKCRAVQFHLKIFSILPALGNCSLKLCEMAVLVKQFFRHIPCYILSGASNPRRSMHASSTRFDRVRSAI